MLPAHHHQDSVRIRFVGTDDPVRPAHCTSEMRNPSARSYCPTGRQSRRPLQDDGDRPGVLPVSKVLFLFQYQPKGDPAKRSAFGKEEEGCGYGVFAAPTETEWSWLLLTPRRFFSFSKKRKKRMVAQIGRTASPTPIKALRRSTGLPRQRARWLAMTLQYEKNK